MTAIFELVEVRHNHFSPYFSFILILATPISRTHLTCKYSQQIISLVSFHLSLHLTIASQMVLIQLCVMHTRVDSSDYLPIGGKKESFHPKQHPNSFPGFFRLNGWRRKIKEDKVGKEGFELQPHSFIIILFTSILHFTRIFWHIFSHK